MSNYKEGDKFVVEIGHGTVDPLYGARYFIKGFNTLVFDDNGLDRLEQVNGVPTLRDPYDEGYKKGLRDAWGCAKKVAMYDVNIYDAFGTTILKRIWDMNPSEAVAKLKEYEAKQKEIRVGDEVEGCFGKWVVFLIDEKNHMAMGLDSDFNYHADKFSDLRRLGETECDIKFLVEQLKGADDELVE